MRVVDHVLVEHGVWIAKDEGRQCLVVGVEIAIIYCFTCGCEEHGVNFSLVGLIWFDPPVFSFERLF